MILGRSGRMGFGLAVSLLASGCSADKPAPAPSPKDIGTAVADTAWDTQVLREASDAVNTVVRNAPDCEAARPLIAGARARLDEAAPRLRTVTGHTTLDALRKQLAKVEELCP